MGKGGREGGRGGGGKYSRSRESFNMFFNPTFIVFYGNFSEKKAFAYTLCLRVCPYI